MPAKGGLREAARVLGKYKFVLPVVLVGLILVVWSGNTETKTPSANQTYVPFPLTETEREMEEALGKIAGAGQVKVVLTLKTDMTLVLQEDQKVKSDTRQDGQSTVTQNEKETKTVWSGGSNGQPVVVRRIYPEFRGALVVCSGSGDPAVRLNVLQAVAALTGLTSDKITVCQ